MNFNDFWDIYISKDITTISDLVIDVFNQKLPDNIEKEYDLGEILTEFTGHHKTAKKYDKIETFGEAVKSYQPKLYEEDGGYINEALIRYYCFLQEEQKLKGQIEDATSRDYDYDLLLQSFKQLLYNQYIEQVNQIIEKEFDKVKKSPKLIDGAEFDLALVKYYIELETLFSEQKDNSNIDFSPFQTKISQYGFNFDDLYYEHQKIGLFDTSLEKLQDLMKEFPNDRSYIMATLEMRFLKWMHSKNCPFPISGMIWYNLFQYFEDRNTSNWKNYFMFEASSFKKFINSKSGFLTNNTIDIALIIWGSSYLLDFIYQVQIILENNYSNQKKLIEEVKNEFKRNNRHDLWEYCFIHKWKPEEKSNSELWNAEKKEFEGSYELDIDHNEFNELKLKKLFGQPFIEENNPSSLRPVIKTKKIGRNEKVDVKYKDGTVLKEVKYKKVINDIEKGKCEII